MKASGGLVCQGVIDGENGKNGYNAVAVPLYRRSSSELNDGNRPSGTLTYTFSTGKLTGPSSYFNGWSQNIPTASANTKLYVIMAVARSQSDTDDIAASDWSTPVEYVADGMNSAPVFIYKRAESVSDKPANGAVYTFATGVLAGTLNGWSTNIPATDNNHYPCWVRQAMAISRNTTDVINASEWSNATKLVEDGDDAVMYDIVFDTAWAKVDAEGYITARLEGKAYKIVGSARSPLVGATIRFGYILNDNETYADTTTNNDGSFSADTWFDGDLISDYAKGSNSIFAAIIIDSSVKCAKYVTIANKGDKGDTGRMCYIAGEFPKKAPYYRTNKLCPVVYYSTRWWYLDAASATANDIPSDSSNKWKELQNYGVVLTDAIFVKQFAQFGAAIITGDWLISVWGKIYDEYGVKTDVDSGSVTEPFCYPSGSSTPAYTYFNPNYPNSSAPNAVNFAPNYAVDLKTGKSYQNDGEFNGVIRAKSMYLEYQEVEVEEVIDPSRGAGIGIPFSYIGQNIYLPLASEYPFITLTFYKYFDASTTQTIARICASGNEEIYTNTELLNNYHYHTYCKSFYPQSNTVIRLHAINGKWCLDCDESKILAFYDDNGNMLTKKE